MLFIELLMRTGPNFSYIFIYIIWKKNRFNCVSKCRFKILFCPFCYLLKKHLEGSCVRIDSRWKSWQEKMS